MGRKPTEIQTHKTQDNIHDKIIIHWKLDIVGGKPKVGIKILWNAGMYQKKGKWAEWQKERKCGTHRNGGGGRAVFTDRAWLALQWVKYH